MTKDDLRLLKKKVQKILKEHPLLFQDMISDHWYLKRKKFLDKNEVFLELLQKELNQDVFELDDALMMQKLYLLYPTEPPILLLSLPWDVMKLLLNICDEKKRKFYIDLCYYKNVDASLLTSYLLGDLYEKVSAILVEIQDSKEIFEATFLDKVMEVSFLIWSSI